MRRLLACLFLLAALPVAAAPDGAGLYIQHCSACHGYDGNGGVGVPLALPDFLSSVSDGYLARTIRVGRPGRVMPAFEDLSDAQVGAIVGHIRGWDKGGKRPPKDGPVTGNAGAGKKLYDHYCSKCHGDNGEGDDGTGVTFSRPRGHEIMAPALNNTGYLASASDRMIEQTLLNGRHGTPMKSYRKKGLSQAQVDDIVAYVRSFAKHPIRYDAQRDAPAVLSYESSYSLKATVENVKRAIVGHNFLVIRVQNLDYGLVPADKEDSKQVIIYFCNFAFIDKALALDPRIGMFMPCRITVVESKGKVTVMSMNPKFMSRLYNNADLKKPCDEMHDTYQDILEEATL